MRLNAKYSISITGGGRGEGRGAGHKQLLYRWSTGTAIDLHLLASSWATRCRPGRGAMIRSISSRARAIPALDQQLAHDY